MTCGRGSQPPRCMGSAVYGPSGCTCGFYRKKKNVDDNLKTCPTCGALPCDQVETGFDMETRFWSIVDHGGPSGLPSDMWEALNRLSANWDGWRRQKAAYLDRIQELENR